MQRISTVVILLTISSIKLIDCGIRVIADERFNKECLTAHNKYRDLHENTQRLEYNRTVIEYAVNRVRTLAKLDGVRPVDSRQVYGEDFYWYYDNRDYHSCHDAVDMWYKGSQHYNYNRPGFSDKTGGFTQVVWRASQALGCARVEDDTRKYFETYIVCNYWPAGNVDNQYPYNVFPLKERDRPSNGGNWGSNNDWSGDRPTAGHKPGSSQRPDERPPIPNKPGASSGGSWTGDRPGSSGSSGSSDGIWVGERPGQRPGMGSVPRPPSPPTYPWVLLHPLIK